jgi:hypothetical protein
MGAENAKGVQKAMKLTGANEIVKGLTVRAGALIAVTVAVALTFTLLLDFLKFDQKLRDVSISRLSMIAEGVRQQSETGLSLDLELAELQDLQDVLRRAAQTRDVKRIELWDEQGRVVFSSKMASVGHQVDASGQVVGDGGKFRWRVRGDELLLALPLRDGSEKIVGQVALLASLSTQRRELEKVRNELLMWTMPLIALALVTTLLAVGITVRLSVRRQLPELGSLT